MTSYLGYMFISWVSNQCTYVSTLYLCLENFQFNNSDELELNIYESRAIKNSHNIY